MSKYVDDRPATNIPSDQSTAQIVAGGVAKAVIASLLVLMVMGCNVGPNYKRPAATTPQSYRGALAPEIAPNAPPTSSLGDQRWSAVFQDAVLQQLVVEALQNNLDLRVAAERVLEAQAQIGIARSQQLPSVSASGGYSALQLPSGLVGKNSDGTQKNSFD